MVEESGQDPAQENPQPSEDEAFRGASGKHTRDVVFGTLAGATAVISDYNPVSELDRMAAVLEEYGDYDTKEGALDAICGMSDDERGWVTSRLRSTKRAYAKFMARIADFGVFFTAENISRIAAWASHPEHPSPFRMTRIERAGSTVVTIQSRQDRLSLAINPSMMAHSVKFPLSD